MGWLYVIILNCTWVSKKTLFAETHIEDCSPLWFWYLVLHLWVVDFGPLVQIFYSVTGIWTSWSTLSLQIMELPLWSVSCIGCSTSSSPFACLLWPSFVAFVAIISIHLIQHCGGVVCKASSGVSSLFCSRSTFFRVNLILSTNSYFDSAVVVADDPCISMKWIGVHKDTHFVLVFSITTLCGDLFKRISHLFRSSLSCIERGMMCIC